MSNIYKVFEIIINSSLEDFNNWLISESKELSRQTVHHFGNEYATMYNPKFREPNVENPHYKFSLDIKVHEVWHDGKTRIRYDVIEGIILEIRRIGKEKIHVIGYWTNFREFERVLEILEQRINNVFCPKKIFENELSWEQSNIPFMEDIPILVFDYIVDTTPDVVLYWLESGLNYFLDNSYILHYPEINQESGIFTLGNSSFFPPDSLFIDDLWTSTESRKDDERLYYYIIEGSVVRIDGNEKFNEGCKEIVVIEIRAVTPERLHVICKSQKIFILIDFFTEMIAQFQRIFEPKSGKHYLDNKTEIFYNLKSPSQQINQYKPGRPHFQEDIWAHEQVNNCGRDPKEVQVDWLERISKNPDRKHNLYESNIRHFKKIIKRDWLDLDD